MAGRPRWAPPDVDLTQPSVARVYDFYLGGSHNFESDRAFARDVLAAMPALPGHAQHNRAFLRRAVQHLSRGGIDQFLDLGSGIPTAGNVHEVAGTINPGARVVYVDRDPVAVAHSQQMLEGHDLVRAVAGDLRSPAEVLADPTLRSTLDLDRPTALMFVSVLHFVSDEDRPREIVEQYLQALAPGSLVVISHGSSDGQPAAQGVRDVYRQARSPQSMHVRTADEITALFGSATLLEPGVVRIPSWRPEVPEDVPADVGSFPGFAGVGLRP